MGIFTKKPARVFLDTAAASPIRPSALRAFTETQSVYGNPSSPHEEGRTARAILEDARERIAHLAQVKAAAVVFTSGATEANALAIEGRLAALLASSQEATDLHVLYMPSAHASTLGAINRLKEKGIHIEEIALDGTAVDLSAFKKQLRKETALVCMDIVCGETGVRFDTRGVKQTLIDSGESGSQITLHVDASQLPVTESFERMRIGADTVTLDAQKVGAVRGIGALIVPSYVELLPIIEGGGQEQGLRPGTESPALALSFAVALEEAQKEKEEFVVRALRARTLLIGRITSSIKNTFVTEGKEQAPNILNFSFLGRDTDYLVALLDEAGFAVSTKSACETDATGSRAVLAYSGDPDRAASTLRVSWGNSITDSDITRFADALIRAVTFLDTTLQKS